MKKAISIMIAFVMLLSCLTITAFAEGQNSKISPTLADKLDRLPEGEKIETCIWLFHQHDAEFIEREAFKECGLTPGTCMTLEEVDIYSKVYNRIAGELESAGNKALIEKIGVSDKDIVFCGTASNLVILNLTKEQIYTISDFKEIQSLDYDDTVLADDPTDLPHYPLDPLLGDEFLAAVRSYYDDDSITFADVVFDFAEEIDTGNYVVRIRILGWEYDSKIISKKIGSYRLSSTDPEPLIYDSKATLSTFDEAYENGIINDNTLEIISGRCHNLRAKEYLRGDADTDGNVSVLDATQIQRYKAELIKEDMLNLTAADVDKDGQVTVLDATQIQRYKAQLCNLDGSTPYTEALE